MQPHNNFFEYLKSFVKLSDTYAKELGEQATTSTIEKGAIYIDKNAYAKNLGFLMKGVMRIYDIDESGQQWNKVFLSTPSFLLGNPNIEERSIHYFEAITPCEVIEFPMGFIKESINKNPKLNELQTKLLLHLFEKKSKREYDFLTLTAKERYLKCLKEYEHIIADIPQFHIASYLGISPTQLSRINTSFKNQQM